jgi:hypothetical protein
VPPIALLADMDAAASIICYKNGVVARHCHRDMRRVTGGNRGAVGVEVGAHEGLG